VSTIPSTSEGVAGARWQVRALAAAAATLAALVVWALAKAIVGDLRQPSFGNGASQPLSARTVIAAALIGGLLGWAAISLLERRTAQPRRIWAVVAPLALVVSLGAPLSGHGIGAVNRLSLVLMHVAVAGVLVPVYYRTAAGRGPSRRVGRS
jgi:hypothetical protein